MNNIPNLGIQPFVAGVETGTQLRRLAMQEEAQQRLIEEAQYEMNKKRQGDAVLKQLMGTAGQQKSATDVLREITTAAQQSPEAATKAYELMKVLSPALKEQLMKEQMAAKFLESKLKTQQAIDEAVGKDTALLPMWQRKKNIEQQLGLERGEADDLRSFFNQSTLEQVKAGLKPEKPKKTKVLTIQDDMGDQVQYLVDADDEGVTLGMRKPGQTEWSFTQEYPRWVLGVESADSLSEALRGDSRIPEDKRLEAAVRIIRDRNVAHYLNDRAAQRAAEKSQAGDFLQGLLSDQQQLPAFGTAPHGTFSTMATPRPTFRGMTQPIMRSTLRNAMNQATGKPGGIPEPPQPPAASNPDFEPEEMFTGVPSSLNVGNPFKALSDLWTRKQNKFVSPYLNR